MNIFKPKVCLIGDSTMGTISNYLRPQTKAIITDLSIWGGDVAGQVSGWNQLTTEQKQAFDYVLIQIGLNNISVAGDSAAVLIGKIQALFDLVISEKSATCKVISSTMTPGLGYNAGFYATWLTVNEAYRGEGATPFIADLYASYHTTKLDDGSGNLKPELDSNDGTHVHPNLTGREYCADDYRQFIDFLYYQAP